MKRLNFFFFNLRFGAFLVLLALISCSKEGSDNPCGEPESGLSTTFRTIGAQYTLPSLNPFNLNELLYVYRENPSEGGHIRVLDLYTKEDRLIHDSFIPNNQPKWVNENTVVFANRQYQVVELNVRTGETEILPFPMRNIYVCADTSENIYSNSSENLAIPYYFLRYTRHNQEIDTLLGPDHSSNGYSTRNDVSGSNQLVGLTSANGVRFIGLKDLDSTDFEILLELKGNFDRFLHSLNWYGNTNAILTSFSNLGIFVINSDTEEINKLIDACWRYNYTSLSSDSENEYIYAEKIIKWDDQDDDRQGLIYQASVIVRIDLDNGLEEEILF